MAVKKATVMMLVNGLVEGKWEHPKLIAERIEQHLNEDFIEIQEDGIFGVPKE